ncbi:hypothetical protein ACQEVB_07630 [Pseudonocardia sp. CA-107938]|uniref:hypothetical protein n=1 Tax=Pseudonocardia sp. CA-107938 TaxID=3240021 RepID=UPI003D8E5366
MSTFTDGAPPSVSPDPGDDPGSANGRESPPMNGEQSDWLQEEIRRRMAARAADGGGARHARRGAPSPFPGTGQSPGHRPPRHATPPGSPASDPVPGPPVPPRPLPSRARRFDANPPAPQPNDTTPPPRPAPGPQVAFDGPALLHPAFGAQAPPESVYGGPVRRGPAFADPALLSDPPPRAPEPPRAPDVAPPPATEPPPRPTPRRRTPHSPPGFALPPSVAFRDGAAAGRAFAGIPGAAAPTPSPVPSRAAETGPVPTVEPPTVDDTGPHDVRNLQRVDPPAAPGTPVGPGLSALGSPPVRTGRRPVPPAGPAAARLLSPPPSPPSTPTGIPVEGPGTSAETGPMVPPPVEPTAPVDGQRPVAVPEQRGGPSELATGPATRRYVDYEDYDDDDYDDPELDAEIAEAARVEAESAEQPETIKRVRVVLAERKSTARPVRTVDDVREGTGVGEVLRRGLIRSQLTVALSFAATALLVLGCLPLVFAYLPEVTRITVLGIRLPWLLLGGLVYPFLLGLGWWHSRAAERVEKGFADHVQG